MTTPSFSLRTARPEDEDFLFRVYSSTRTEELKLTNWDEAQKQAFLKMQFAGQQTDYSSRYPKADHQIILWGQEPVGRLYISRTGDEIHILDVTILPEHRGAGIGSAVLGEILLESKKDRKPVRIYVETFNPSLRLFERLGFSKVEDAGFHRLLEWKPSSE
jgi:ribosomal protein S18 acetylase RimI-like enzyme